MNTAGSGMLESAFRAPCIRIYAYRVDFYNYGDRDVNYGELQSTSPERFSARLKTAAPPLIKCTSQLTAPRVPPTPAAWRLYEGGSGVSPDIVPQKEDVDSATQLSVFFDGES